MEKKYSVAIAGGGPVGLTLAIDLGRRGIDVLLVEKRLQASNLPKMERCHPRTMEIFARLGIAERVRAVGYGEDDPYDAFFVRTLAEPPIQQIVRPSVNELRARSHARNDGSFPAEPYQIVSQYAIEPLLREIAEATPGVRVVFGCELQSFEERDGEVILRLRHASGEEERVAASYLVGADGGASTVRQALGIALEGEPQVHDFIQAHFRCEKLFDRIPMGSHYFRCDDRWSFLITQGDCEHFTLHAEAEDTAEMPALFEAMLGFPIDYEMVYAGKWTMRLMLAERYASRRVFLAGDSAHLVTPLGGLGMNTGIGDATDLAWKLDAVLKGWGGPHLLASYEAERRPIGWRNVKTSERGYLVQRGWRERCGALQLHRDTASADMRAGFGGHWMEQHLKGSQGLLGITMGYRYHGSPIVCAEAGDDAADQKRFDYVPTTLPGARVPHVWLPDGRALQDAIRGDFTLLCRATPPAEVETLAAAFARRGARFAVLALGTALDTAPAYDRDYLLVRPDLHVCWRGDRLPADAAAVVAQVCGDIASERRDTGPFEIRLESAALEAA